MFTHNELVLIAAKWVKKNLKFPIVTTELKTTGSREIPDVLAFRSNTSQAAKHTNSITIS